jgi:exosortase
MANIGTAANNSPRIGGIAVIGILFVSFFFLYHKVIISLVHDWKVDDNYSHGFFIVPVALYFVWERRNRLAYAAPQPSFFGIILIVMSLATLLAGILGAELFLTRISILGVVAGAILFICGWQHLRILTLPILFLLLMIPIPAIVFNQIAFPLQLVASRFGEFALSIVGIPVLREGNIIQLANTNLEVVEACSGIRSLISLLTLAIIYGYFSDSRMWARVLLSISTFPIAILANGLRVSFTGILAQYYGPKAAQGFFHSFSGWIIFLVAFVMLFSMQQLLKRVNPSPRLEIRN